MIILLGPWMLGQLVAYTTALYTVDPHDGGLVNELLSKLAGNELAGFILVLARVTPLFFIAPLFSSEMIPPRVRGLIAVGISIGLAPIALHGQHIPTDAADAGRAGAQGLLVGLGFAFTLARADGAPSNRPAR